MNDLHARLFFVGIGTLVPFAFFESLFRFFPAAVSASIYCTYLGGSSRRGQRRPVSIERRHYRLLIVVLDKENAGHSSRIFDPFGASDLIRSFRWNSGFWCLSEFARMSGGFWDGWVIGMWVIASVYCEISILNYSDDLRYYDTSVLIMFEVFDLSRWISIFYCVWCVWIIM